MNKTLRLFTLFAGVCGAMVMMSSCQSGDTSQSTGGSGRIVVVADSTIDLNMVKVDWVSPERETISVFENGKPTGAKIPRANRDLFEFYLANTAIGSAGITRSSAKNKHDFFFRIFRRTDEKDPLIQMVVKGPDSTNAYFSKRYVRDLVGDITREEFFDPKGLKMYETFSNYDRNGELLNTNKYEYTYDVWGNKASQEHYAWAPDGSLKHRARNTFRYDEAGNMLEMTFTSYEPNGNIKTDNTNRYTYNDLGQVLEREFISYTLQGKVENHYITAYIYDESGQANTEILYDANRRKINMLQRTLDDRGALIKDVLTEYNPDGSIKSVHGKEYGPKGEILREY
ncbi:MAG: hypothetical protein KA053_01335 [Lentimicrobiaceae bacterium]|nr:hypothetical protein [Lentimicrobiaceae bacterium]